MTRRIVAQNGNFLDLRNGEQHFIVFTKDEVDRIMEHPPTNAALYYMHKIRRLFPHSDLIFRNGRERDVIDESMTR